jgi:methionyl-tRNA synthetase
MMEESKRKILVTSALPYANGSIHIGHMVEYIQTDVWVRFQKMMGQECYFVCADDAHGTPIMLKAEAENVSPEILIERISREHQRDFTAFGIEFDNYHSTHSEENRHISEFIFAQLKKDELIVTRTIEQAYDPVKGMFLPDRFVRGTCPKCGAIDQYGDSCEACGATYSPTDLIDPLSVVSGVAPELKESEHLFFTLAKFQDVLRDWVATTKLHPGVVKKLEDWFETGLKDWDISRDAPYFGFEIPDNPGKYFYVWLDAPVGYLASFKKLCVSKGIDFESFLRPDSNAELYHFIGKDIIYFHTLFWPAMLKGAGYRLPTNVFVHGFLTINGKKMSKSRGSFIKAETYLSFLSPEYLRYYFSAKLTSGIEDIDLSWDDFEARVNSDLVGKFVNIGSRCAGFIAKRFDGKLADEIENTELMLSFLSASREISAFYEAREYGRAMREIMGLADLANRYIDNEKPWVLAKGEDTDRHLHLVVTMGVLLFRILAIYLKPVIPKTILEVEKFLREPSLAWLDIHEAPLGKTINKFIPLIERVDSGRIVQMIEEVKTGLEKEVITTQDECEEHEHQISIEDFLKIDLRVAKIIGASSVDGADKLLKLELDIGDERRQVFAGIKQAYDPNSLIGRMVVVVANLAPRKMRFGLSEGMILAAGPGGSDVFLLEPSIGSEPGMKIK